MENDARKRWNRFQPLNVNIPTSEWDTMHAKQFNRYWHENITFLEFIAEPCVFISHFSHILLHFCFSFTKHIGITEINSSYKQVEIIWCSLNLDKWTKRWNWIWRISIICIKTCESYPEIDAVNYCLCDWRWYWIFVEINGIFYMRKFSFRWYLQIHCDRKWTNICKHG